MDEYVEEYGVYVYVCTREDMGKYPIVRRVRYRCKICGRIDVNKNRALWHRRWRWLTDWRKQR